MKEELVAERPAPVLHDCEAHMPNCPLELLPGRSSTPATDNQVCVISETCTVEHQNRDCLPVLSSMNTDPKVNLWWLKFRKFSPELAIFGRDYFESM